MLKTESTKPVMQRNMTDRKGTRHVAVLVSSLLATIIDFDCVKKDEGHKRCPSAMVDPAVKQILLAMNEKQSFIIDELDDYHLVIKADEEYRVRRDLETELEKNTYSLEGTS
ncbi:hypothetical protein ONZ45_g3374 [Pleurotus djamor]|nr:hypothetical protein ONZ45_g5753 [Pleurotus djamor]KAJ8519744.1 hypothetical protein ONZ45_g3374 [Pleurotus djamor]